MATSVKVDERTKDKLEELQAEIRLETGRTVTQQALLDRIVAREFESKAALIDSFREDWDGLSEAEIERWLSGTMATADPVSEAEIDRIVYDEQVIPDLEDES